MLCAVSVGLERYICARTCSFAKNFFKAILSLNHDRIIPKTLKRKTSFQMIDYIQSEILLMYWFSAVTTIVTQSWKLESSNGYVQCVSMHAHMQLFCKVLLIMELLI